MNAKRSFQPMVGMFTICKTISSGPSMWPTIISSLLYVVCPKYRPNAATNNTSCQLNQTPLYIMPAKRKVNQTPLMTLNVAVCWLPCSFNKGLMQTTAGPPNVITLYNQFCIPCAYLLIKPNLNSALYSMLPNADKSPVSP
jgi:hypothetical protein